MRNQQAGRWWGGQEQNEGKGNGRRWLCVATRWPAQAARGRGGQVRRSPPNRAALRSLTQPPRCASAWLFPRKTSPAKPRRTHYHLPESAGASLAALPSAESVPLCQCQNLKYSGTLAHWAACACHNEFWHNWHSVTKALQTLAKVVLAFWHSRRLFGLNWKPLARRDGIESFSAVFQVSSEPEKRPPGDAVFIRQFEPVLVGKAVRWQQRQQIGR